MSFITTKAEIPVTTIMQVNICIPLQCSSNNNNT